MQPSDSPDTRPFATVLIVTPDRNLRAAAERALRADGYRVLTAAHAGHAVLACLKAGRVDVFAVELAMEDVSGPALAERLRRHAPGAAVVYFANCGTAECEGVIVRPFTRDDLLAALATARASATAWEATWAS